MTTETKTTPKTKAPAKVGHKTLVEALAAFQADMPNVTLDGFNPGFKSKFATLAGMTNIIIPKLNAQGIVYTATSEVSEDSKLIVVAKLVHAGSNEESVAKFPVSAADPQKIGSAVTYFRRYGRPCSQE